MGVDALAQLARVAQSGREFLNKEVDRECPDCGRGVYLVRHRKRWGVYTSGTKHPHPCSPFQECLDCGTLIYTAEKTQRGVKWRRVRVYDVLTDKVHQCALGTVFPKRTDALDRAWSGGFLP